MSVSFIIFFSPLLSGVFLPVLLANRMQQIGCVHEAACAVGKILAGGAVSIKICILIMATL
jgi:hypothetical protein